jgi:glycosyltransferase involved in cell wall biosynthesis
MDALISTEYRFDQTSDGHIWTETLYAYSEWQNYLEVFDRVFVLARVGTIPTTTSTHTRSDGEQVQFIPLPYYVGPWQYLLQSRKIQKITRQAARQASALFLRIPSQLASTMFPLPQGRPYAVEVIGDPYDVFAPNTIKTVLRPFLRRWFAYQQRQQCWGASAVTYVTQHILQKRYPPHPQAFSNYYSNLDWAAIAWLKQPRSYDKQQTSFQLITVASLAQLYKAPDLLIESVRQCVQQGMDITLKIVGDGKYRPQLEAQVTASGLERRVFFVGQLPSGDPIHEQLDQSDLFVLPSRTEGLPRAIVEAMARALPCIGSTAGGIPELLLPEDMVTAGDAQALARKIREVLADPQRMTKMSARNLEKSQEYHSSILRKRRLEFYQYVKQVTEDWLQKD